MHRESELFDMLTNPIGDENWPELVCVWSSIQLNLIEFWQNKAICKNYCMDFWKARFEGNYFTKFYNEETAFTEFWQLFILQLFLRKP